MPWAGAQVCCPKGSLTRTFRGVANFDLCDPLRCLASSQGMMRKSCLDLGWTCLSLGKPVLLHLTSSTAVLGKSCRDLG